jgi:hypothetical protein
MTGRIGAIALACAGLAACATAPMESEPAAVESISFETGPCFGACPVYLVTVGSDGSGVFEGRRFTAADSRREFRITPDQYRAFARQLEPLRPASGAVRYSGDSCASMATDLPSADVKWRTSGGAEQELYFYFGCDMEKNRAIAERIRKAPDLLPIAQFIRRGE